MTAAIVGVALLAAVAVVYAVAAAPAAAPYSELSLLEGNSSDAPLADVPDAVPAGTTLEPVVAVGNHRGAETEYTLVVVVDHLGDDGSSVTDRRIAHRLTPTVASGDVWRGAPTVTLDTPGDVRVRYLLFSDGAPATPTLDGADLTVSIATSVTDGNGTAAT